MESQQTPPSFYESRGVPDRTPEEEQLVTDIYYLDLARSNLNPSAILLLEKYEYPIRANLDDLRARMMKQLEELRANK